MNRLLRTGVLVVVFAVLLAGCGKTSGGGEASAAERQRVDVLRALPIGDAALDVVSGVLSDAGVGLHDDGTEVTSGKPVRLMRWQVRNLTTEAANGGGIAGADLRELVPLPPGAPPLPYLVAAWAKTYGSAGARFARELMGEQDWSAADRILFPNLVLTLFLADALNPAATGRSMTNAGLHFAEPCTFATTFIQHAINDVAKALKVNTAGGGIGGFLGSIWNIAVDVAATAVKGLIATVTKPVVDAIADVFGIVALVTQLSSLLTKWRVELRADPSHTRFGVDSEVVSGQFRLTVTQPQLPIPDVIVNCADAFQVDLRTAGSAAGSKLTWRERNTGRGDLSTRTGADDALAQNKTAQYRYRTGQESSELAKSPDTETSALVVSVNVHRNDVQQARQLFTKVLFDRIPANLRGIVEGLAKPLLNQADSRLAALSDLTASARTFITYHVRRATPTAPALGTGTGSVPTRKGTMPTICPDTGVITKGFPRPVNGGPWEFDGEILPAHLLRGAKTCGYSAWLGPKDPVTGFQQVEQVGLYLFPEVHPPQANARPVTIPGTDRAWFEGPLKVVIGDRTLAVEIRIRATEDLDAAAVRVAKAILGLG